jgi:hypothetical protein
MKLPPPRGSIARWQQASGGIAGLAAVAARARPAPDQWSTDGLGRPAAECRPGDLENRNAKRRASLSSERERRAPTEMDLPRSERFIDLVL